MLFPQPVRASTLLIALLVGVAVGFSASLLLKMWFPRLAPVLFIVIAATWIYAGWSVTFIPRHRS
jgi:hypothetical protein